MQVIAERDKRLGKIILGLSVVLIGCSGFLVTVSLWYVFLLIISAFLAVTGVYCGLLLPQTALKREDDTLIICYAFRERKIAFSKIEYVNYPELGTFATRDGGLFTNAYILQNDVRRLTITTKENAKLKHFYVLGVLHASAVATTINSYIEEAKKNN